jgi:hypothetical protein
MTRTGIKVDLDVGDFVSNAGRAKGAIAALTDAMKKAEKEKRWDDWSKLKFDRDRLEYQNTGFERDIKNFANNPRFQTKMEDGSTVFKMDAEYAALIKGLTDSIKKLAIEYEEAIKTGDFTKARELAPQIMEKQAEFHKMAEDTNKPTGIQAMVGVIKSIGINQISNAINDGFSRWVGSLDQSGIVNQYGSGDILGGRIAEERRQADMKGGIAQTGLGMAGTIAGLFLPGGPLVWGAVGSGAGKFADSLLHIGPNQEATKAAYAGLWQSRSADAMELAALRGEPNKVRDAFNTAANVAAKSGYSAEEGMEAMKEAARQGLSGEEAAAVTQKAFDYERRTGADRGTLTGISNLSARYDAGDALGMGWAGLQASGMKPGQYNEYLRAMQRVMEEGISKGFIRSSEDVAKNLTMLSRMTGNNPLWQGENGARRLSEMNSGLEGTTGLQSTSDIIAYRAAKNVLQKWEEQGPEEANKKWAAMVGTDKDGNSLVQRSGGYIDPLIMLERGITPELFNEIMMMASKLEGRDRDETISRAMGIFSVDNYKAAVLTDQWKKLTNNGENPAPLEDMQAIIDKYGKAPPPANSPDLDAAKITEAIKNWWVQTGISQWDKNFIETLNKELQNAIRGHNNETGSNVPVPGSDPADTSGMTPAEAVSIRQQEYKEALESGDDDWITRATIALERALMEALAPKPVNDPIDEETRRVGEIDRMLMKSGMPWDKDRAAFFTGDGNPFTKNDDEKTNDRLMAYGGEPTSSPARQAFDEFIGHLKTIKPEHIQKLNERDDINKIIPDIMTDKTGQLLLDTIRELKEITIRYDNEN